MGKRGTPPKWGDLTLEEASAALNTYPRKLIVLLKRGFVFDLRHSTIQAIQDTGGVGPIWQSWLDSRDQAPADERAIARALKVNRRAVARWRARGALPQAVYPAQLQTAYFIAAVPMRAAPPKVLSPAPRRTHPHGHLTQREAADFLGEPLPEVILCLQQGWLADTATETLQRVKDAGGLESIMSPKSAARYRAARARREARAAHQHEQETTVTLAPIPGLWYVGLLDLSGREPDDPAYARVSLHDAVQNREDGPRATTFWAEFAPAEREWAQLSHVGFFAALTGGEAWRTLPMPNTYDIKPSQKVRVPITIS